MRKLNGTSRACVVINFFLPSSTTFLLFKTSELCIHVRAVFQFPIARNDSRRADEEIFQWEMLFFSHASESEADKKHYAIRNSVLESEKKFGSSRASNSSRSGNLYHIARAGYWTLFTIKCEKNYAGLDGPLGLFYRFFVNTFYDTPGPARATAPCSNVLTYRFKRTDSRSIV